MRNIAILFSVSAVIITSFIFYAFGKNETSTITISGHQIIADIAQNSAEQYKGLSGKKNLCNNCGMLFVFPVKGERTFVMRDMLFPLDIIWINNGRIYKIDKNLPPDDSENPKTYESGIPIDCVLEVNAGFADKNNIKTGDIVDIQ